MPTQCTSRRNPYDRAHRRTRTAMIRDAIGTVCPGDYVSGRPWRSANCHGIMTNPRQMHLAHTVPVALGGTQGDRICCAPCNLGAGAILGKQLRAPAPRRSRIW